MTYVNLKQSISNRMRALYNGSIVSKLQLTSNYTAIPVQDQHGLKYETLLLSDNTKLAIYLPKIDSVNFRSKKYLENNFFQEIVKENSESYLMGYFATCERSDKTLTDPKTGEILILSSLPKIYNFR